STTATAIAATTPPIQSRSSITPPWAGFCGSTDALGSSDGSVDGSAVGSGDGSVTRSTPHSGAVSHPVETGSPAAGAHSNAYSPATVWPSAETSWYVTV